MSKPRKRPKSDESGHSSSEPSDVSDREDIPTKVFNDPIHGHIGFHPLCVRIIDTPQFQRLRYIKQLGCAYMVFPGAAHNRFEHSLGVGHLAGKFCRALKERQTNLEITEEDVLCVEIAGLCHDLGHGPFSHVFDNQFIPEVERKRLKDQKVGPSVGPKDKWKHEKASVKMFVHLIEANQLKDVFAEFRLEDQDITFIKELIDGPQTKGNKKPSDWKYDGRPKDKSFLYEIVSNERNGIDVDKWDYFLRDCHNLGIKSTFDYHRFIQFSRVIKANGDRQICFREKEADNVYEMFHTRTRLHRRAYQHKVTKIIETMIVDALVEANAHILIEGKTGTLKMSEAIDDMVAYTKLTDDIMLQIMRYDDPKLKESLKKSRGILERVQKRKLYKFIGEKQAPEDTTKDIPEIKQQIIKALGPKNTSPTEDHLVIHIAKFNYGNKDKNPIDNVRFYSKTNPNEAFPLPKEKVSKMLPDCFEEQYIRVYCKEPKVEDRATKCFNAWCLMKDKPDDQGPDPPCTPAKPKDGGKSQTFRPKGKPRNLNF